MENKVLHLKQFLKIRIFLLKILIFSSNNVDRVQLIDLYIFYQKFGFCTSINKNETDFPCEIKMFQKIVLLHFLQHYSGLSLSKIVFKRSPRKFQMYYLVSFNKVNKQTGIIQWFIFSIFQLLISSITNVSQNIFEVERFCSESDKAVQFY